MNFSAGLSKGLSKPFRPPMGSDSSNSLSTPNSKPKPFVSPSTTVSGPKQENSEPNKFSFKGFNAPKKLPEAVIQQKVEAEASFDRIYFNVFYTKDVKKKTKSYNEGILEITKSKIKIYDNEGKDVYDTSRGRFFKDKPKEEEEYYLGSYMSNFLVNSDKNLVQIQKPVPVEEFNSGRCFLSKTALIDKKPMVTTSSLCHKKMKQSPRTQDLFTEVIIPEGAYVLTNETEDKKIVPCYIDPFLSNQMRPHQKEGVKFMFECVCGLRAPEINGCILADSMGLGKTLQTIALIWTLLKKNPHSQKKPFVNKVIVVSPLTLVKNWEKEVIKWLGSARLQSLVAIGTKEQVGPVVEKFKTGYYRCLLTSYEVFKTQAEKLNGSCDLLVFDEGHRLKNMNLKSFKTYSQFSCKKRLILTGTPLQNCLEELYSCSDLINPGIFSSLNTFKKVFVNPILAGLKKNATPANQEIAQERSKELSKIISSFILRRPGTILNNILPPKHEYFIFLQMTDLQREAYKKILNTKIYNKNMTETTGEAFSIILGMRKLLNFPGLLLEDKNDIAKIAQSSFGSEDFTKEVWNYSNKLLFVKNLLEQMPSSDKVVIVSYFKQTLDIVEIICSATDKKFLRLDGDVAALNRQKLVDRFNDKTTEFKVFLLCAKAGGTGLNLTGANRMILMEADWNPSNDNQVMGRIWRDGQKKEAQIYRLISCGTIEERMIQRQFVKENLSLNVVDERNIKSMFDTSDIKKVFKFENDTECITFKEDENEREFIFENNLLFENMQEYIIFIKRKTDITKVELDEEEKKAPKVEEKIINQFESENIFLVQEEIKKDKEDTSEEKLLGEEDEIEYTEDDGDDEEDNDDENEESDTKDIDESSRTQTTEATTRLKKLSNMTKSDSKSNEDSSNDDDDEECLYESSQSIKENKKPLPDDARVTVPHLALEEIVPEKIVEEKLEIESAITQPIKRKDPPVNIIGQNALKRLKLI